MRRCRLLVAACLGTMFYVAMAVIGGRDGIWAMNQLLEQKRVMSAHTAEIEKTFDELTLEKLALQKDADVIAAYARKLGYVSEGEKLVKITGLAARETHVFDPGTVVRHSPVTYIPEWLCKVSGFSIMFLIYAIMVVCDIQRGYINLPRFAKKSASMGGTVVYDCQ